MPALLAMKNIRKSFSGVPVLHDVSFDLAGGEVHVVAGENGAGKTTLINIMAGVHTDYAGEIELEGERVRFSSPHAAAKAGISVMHQETSLAGALTTVDNIFLGRERIARRSAGMLVDRGRQRREAADLCRRLDLDIDLERPVDEHPISVKQRIEIAKALVSRSRILVMDEPTSALSAPEVERLFDIVAGLKRDGVGVVYITHRMEEIYRLADRITVLRDGRLVGTARATDLPEPELVRWMIGRELSSRFPQRSDRAGEERFRVGRFTAAPARDVSFSVRSGEVLGIAGLQGSGAAALLAGLYAAGMHTGEVWLDGARVVARTPADSIRAGMAYLGSDRKATGLIFGMDVGRNISLAALRKVSRCGFLDAALEAGMAQRGMESLKIRAASPRQDVGSLSGGNQQKVLLARWAETEPKVLLLDEPTRGIDVGSKHEIYALIDRWASAGMAIVLITSELEELLGLSDRILVMHRGRVGAEFPREEATRERILLAAMGKAWSATGGS